MASPFLCADRRPRSEAPRPAPGVVGPLFLCLIMLATLEGCGYRPLGGVRVPGRPALAEAAGNRAAAEAVAEDGREVLLSDAPGLANARPRVSVLALRNDSPEPWLDRIVGDALRRELAARGNVRLVNDPDDADLVLRGRIRPLVVVSRSFSSFVAALEYSVTLVLDLDVARSSGVVTRLDPTMLSESDVYLASADIEVTRTHRLEALRRLSDVLATRIADSLDLMEQPIRGAARAPSAAQP